MSGHAGGCPTWCLDWSHDDVFLLTDNPVKLQALVDMAEPMANSIEYSMELRKQ